MPRIARAEISFCAGMSEPNAGSDLAALATRADADGDDFVIRGQKIWTSFATEADYCYLVARTDPTAPRHKGISELLISMRTPGITVRPIRDMVGESHFGELFFDDVRVPKSALIGKLHNGFYQIMQQLDFERSGIERLVSNAPLWRAAKAHARDTGRARATRRCATASPSSRSPGARAAASSTAWPRCSRRGACRITRPRSRRPSARRSSSASPTRSAEIFGASASLDARDPRAPLGGRAARTFLYAARIHDSRRDEQHPAEHHRDPRTRPARVS